MDDEIVDPLAMGNSLSAISLADEALGNMDNQDLFCTGKVRLQMAMEKAKFSGQPVIKHRVSNATKDFNMIFKSAAPGNFEKKVTCCLYFRMAKSTSVPFSTTLLLGNSCVRIVLTHSPTNTSWNDTCVKFTKNIC